MQDEDGKPWRSLIERVRRVASLLPDAVAAESETGRYTYRELIAVADERAALIADRLRGCERLVAVCLERTHDLPAWLLAIVRARAAYLPLDATVPSARIAQILADANPALIVANRACLTALPPTDITTIIAEDRPEGGPIPVPLPEEWEARDLAYVMYTSGSTGRPKGVEIEHGAITALLDATQPMELLASGERMLAATRIAFDLSVLEMFLPLTVGASVVVATTADTADPRRLSRFIDRFRPDLVQATPAAYRSLMEGGWPRFAPPRLLCGGEPLTADLAQRLLPGCGALWNVYGPTEATVWSAVHPIIADDVRTPGSCAIGRPIAGTEIVILDADGGEVAAGENGEIAIVGPSLARGYRGEPALTAARFVALADGRRAYRTGDVGRLADDGLLHCCGRSDDQVKIRGCRVEPSEVEAVLGAHPEVAWCAVKAWEDSSGETMLAAYVVANTDPAIVPRSLAVFLADRLPPYMIPMRFVGMPRLPQTANGKIDRLALPNPFARPAVTPGTDTLSTREALAAIWREILVLPEIVDNDDFFELGGYSLMTVRLQRLIEERFGKVIELPTLLRASTLVEMTALIDGGNRGALNGITLLGGVGGAAPPLFWLDAGPLMRGLARTLGGDQPMAALNVTLADEAKLIADVRDAPLDITAIAAILRKRLARAHPRGPVFLGGWCRWGVVAHELACQLRERGRAVALLVLLDAEAPHETPFARMCRLLGRGPRREAPASFSQYVEAAARVHRSRHFAGPALLLRSAEARRDAGGWRPHVAALTVETVPGDHLTMVRHPHVAQVGEAISRALRAGHGMAANPHHAVRRHPVQLPVMARYRAPVSVPLLATTSDPSRAPLADRTTRLIE